MLAGLACFMNQESACFNLLLKHGGPVHFANENMQTLVNGLTQFCLQFWTGKLQQVITSDNGLRLLMLISTSK